MANCDSKPYGVIYCIEHKETGKKYIGQTTQSILTRWKDHKKNGSYCLLLSRAIQKHGSDSFSIYELADASSKDELNEKEIFYISLFDSTSRQNGYNLRGGGSFGKHSDESKERMSKSVMKAYENPEFREKLIASRTGKKRSVEYCNRASKRMLGNKLSPDAKEKISTSVAKHWKSDEYRKRVSEGQKIARSSNDYKLMVAANTRAQWSDNECKKNLISAQTEGKLAMWADPARKAAILAKRAATKAAKREAILKTA